MFEKKKASSGSGFLRFLIFEYGAAKEKPYQGRGEMFGIDNFFIFRVIGFLLLGLVLTAGMFFVSYQVTGVWIGFNPTALMPLLPLAICLGYAGKLFYMGKTGKYFVLELTCISIDYSKSLANPKGYLNSFGEGMLRATKRGTFAADDGKKVSFIFDRAIRLIEHQKYAFYFKNHSDGRKETTFEELAALKIGHVHVPTNLTSDESEGDEDEPQSHYENEL